jgi:hypothetical protein
MGGAGRGCDAKACSWHVGSKEPRERETDERAAGDEAAAGGRQRQRKSGGAVDEPEERHMRGERGAGVQSGRQTSDVDSKSRPMTSEDVPDAQRRGMTPFCDEPGATRRGA